MQVKPIPIQKLSILLIIPLIILIFSAPTHASRMYGAISNDMPNGLVVDHLIDLPNSLKKLATPATGHVDGWGIAYYPNYIVDAAFNDSFNSHDLRYNSSGQDWYESRGVIPDQLALDILDVKGNRTPKAKLSGSNLGSTYLTQEFSTSREGKFSVRFDIYVDEIADTSNPDRSGYILIGDDQDEVNGPNSSSLDRFVYMAFYKAGGGTSGTMDLVARQPGDGWGGGEFTKIATGLNLDQWYTIRLEVDIINSTYDVYLDGSLKGSAIAAWDAKARLTHISFATLGCCPGIFFIDNVLDTIERGAKSANTDSNFDAVVNRVNEFKPKLIQAQIRSCTAECCDHGNETIIDPFPLFRDKNGKRWTFSHDGSVSKILLRSLIGDIYLNAHRPFGSEISACFSADPSASQVLDSELYFLYLLKKIEESAWNTVDGIVAAVNELMSYGENGLNFILSDGDTIWAFRKAEFANQTLYYLHDPDLDYSAVASQYPTQTQNNWVAIGDETLVILTADKSPVIVDPFAYDDGVIVDSRFDKSANDSDLRADGSGQDWYESVGQNPNLLTLNGGEIGGNSSAKAQLTSSPGYTTYLTQEFSKPQTGLFTVQWEIFVDQLLTLSVSIAAGSISENGGSTQATVTRHNGTTGNLVVNLFSSDTAEATVPDTVTILDGSDSATFTLTAVDDALTDGVQLVTITASAAGHINGAVTVKVIDDETDLSVIPQAGWSLWYVDSEELTAEDGAAINAFDDDPTTIWHTHYLGDNDPIPPHEIQINLGASYEIQGFRYLPRQVGVNGGIDQYEFYVSNDGTTWSSPAATGSFANDATEKEVLFNPVIGQFIRLRALREINGNPWTSAAEINVLGETSPELLDDATHDLNALMMIGDDADGINGPNSSNADRFIVLAMYHENNGGGQTSGTMDLIAYEPGDQYDNPSTWHQVATDLEFDEWQTIAVKCDVVNNTYDVYVNGVLAHESVNAYTTKTNLTHISFAQSFDGAATLFVDNVREIKLPHAAFYADPLSGPMPLDTNFLNISAGANETVLWDFGDGGSSTLLNPVYTYDYPGLYSVTMTVENTAGGDLLTRQNFIEVQPVEIINDNTGDDFETVGDWRTSTYVADFYGENYHYSAGGSGNDRAIWHVSIPKSGVYKVFAWWSDALGRAPNAPFTINYAFGSRTVSVDQRVNGTQWNELGEFYFEEGEYTISLTDDSSGFVIADAIKLVFANEKIPQIAADFYAGVKTGQAPAAIKFHENCTGQISAYEWDFGDGSSSTEANPSHTYSSPGLYNITLTVSGPGGNDTLTKTQYIEISEVEIIMDNSDPGIQTVGSWPESIYVPGFYSTNYQYNKAGIGADQVSWSFTVPKAGIYKVYGWWTAGENRAPNALFSIDHAFGTTTVQVDQRISGGRWNEIGQVYFENDTYSITLTDEAQGFVIADAVRVVLQSDDIPAPQANFAADRELGLAPLSVKFFDKSTGYINNWNWDFGDGTSSDDQNPAHTYERDGEYTVKLTVSGDGGSDTKIDTFFIKVARDTLILDNSDAEYVGNWPESIHLPGYYSENYQYNRSGIGDDKAVWRININKAGTYRLFAWWTSNSNRASNAPFIIEHAFGTYEVRKDQRIDGGRWNQLGEFYFNEGQYDVILTDQADGYVIADAMRFTFLYSEILPSEADFISDVSAGSPPLQVHYNDRSSGKINRWEWDFGDGATSSEQNPTHTYDQHGVYSVSLTVYDDNGNDTKFKQNYMIVSDVDIIIDNLDPEFQAIGSWPESTYTPAYYSTNYQYNFTGVGDDQAIWNFTIPKTGTYKVFAWWTSGDGRSSKAPFMINHAFGSITARVDQRNNGSRWHEIGEVFFKADDYSVVLTDDADGYVIADAIRMIFIGDEVPVDFSADKQLGLKPLTVKFNALGNGETANWLWEFGDGNSSDEMNPTHIYNEAGRYSVTLTRTDDQGSRSETKSEYITVSDIEIIKDNSDPDFETAGSWPESTYVAGYYSTNYQHNFAGDGNEQATWNFVIPRAGLYKVFAWWTTGDNRSPNAPFTINHTFGGTTVRIDQRINGSQWNEIGEFYFEEGDFSVQLTDDAEGYVIADAVRLLFITVEPPPPEADFIHSVQLEQTTSAMNVGEAPTTVQFTDKSEGLIVDWFWDFGDGNTSDLKNPTHTYTQPGVYSVSLMVVDTQNNVDTFIEEHAVVVTEAENTESIYLFFGYSGGHARYKIQLTEAMLAEIGAFKKDNFWLYWNEENNNIYFIEFIEGPAGYSRWKDTLKIENAHLIYTGHANFGSGHVFPESDTEVWSQTINGVKHVDDERILNFQSKYFSFPIYYYINSQAFPDWQPTFSDGVSAVMPYEFNDLEFDGDPDNPGIPAFNYYITYQVPGDSTRYKLETLHHGAIERFIGSGRPAWYSPDGDVPDPDNPDHQKYFIINPSGTGIRNHYGSKTIFYRRELEVDPRGFKYSRMFLHTCNSGYYYTETYNRGVLFYTLEDYRSVHSVPIYLKYYLLGNSDEEIYDAIQAEDPVFDYHNFGEPPPDTPPTFALQWNILIDEIIDQSENPDRAGGVFIGTDSGSSSGPNGTDTDRFIQMAFYKNGGGDTGEIILVARTRHDSWSSWSTLATDLELDKWYTIKVVCDLIHDTFDVYIDGNLVANDVVSRTPKDTVTHLTFAQQKSAAGTFYVDNVLTVFPESEIIADGNFDASSESEDLRYDGGNQDWYESRKDVPGLITLNTENIDGNSTKKVKFQGSISGNAYLTQELNPQQTK